MVVHICNHLSKHLPSLNNYIFLLSQQYLYGIQRMRYQSFVQSQRQRIQGLECGGGGGGGVHQSSRCMELGVYLKLFICLTKNFDVEYYINQELCRGK